MIDPIESKHHVMLLTPDMVLFETIFHISLIQTRCVKKRRVEPVDAFFVHSRTCHFLRSVHSNIVKHSNIV